MGGARGRLLVRPVFWVAVYLALIPTFALLYVTVLEGDFAQPNSGSGDPARFEAARRDIGETFALSLRPFSTYSEAPESHHLAGVISSGDRIVPIFYIGSGTGSDNLAVGIVDHREDCASPRPWVSVIPVDFSIPLQSIPGVPITGDDTPVPSVTWDDESAGAAAEWISLFTQDVMDNRQAPALPVDPAACRQLTEGVRRLYTGDPTFGAGGYRRMLYFSAVTITTVGYGDIVPVRDGARLAAGAEAVLGVVVAGLFLNALWRARTS